MSSLRSMPPRSIWSDFFWTVTMTSLACHLAESITAWQTAGAPAGVDVDVGARAGLAEGFGGLAVQFGQGCCDVLGGGVDDRVGADGQCGLPARG